jgi:hypothetical protein
VEGGQLLFLEGLSDFLSANEEVDPSVEDGSGLLIHPNPFTHMLFATFNLVADGDVLIDLRNISGQLVQTLYDGQLSAGPHTLPLSVRETPVGVYALTVRTSQQVITKVIVKSE